MWLAASAFCHLCPTFSVLSQNSFPRAISTGSRCLRFPAPLPRGASFSRRRFASGARSTSTTPRAAAADIAEIGEGGSMVPDDVAALLKEIFQAKPTPQVCLTTTGSGGQAISWVLGVPGASSCLLEAKVPYSLASCDQIMAPGPPAPSYCSPEAAEALARDAYARAVELCVADSSEGPNVLATKRVVGVGCTAAVVSSQPKRGLHRCFVCAQTSDGLARYQLTMAKGKRDRNGEDVAVSRVLLQAVAEASGISVPHGFKADHLFNDDETGKDETRETAAGGDPPNSSPVKDEITGMGELESKTMPSRTGAARVEAVPIAEYCPEPDAVKDLLDGKGDAVMIVPRDSHASSAFATSDHSTDRTARDRGADESDGVGKSAVLRGRAVPASLPRGATVILPGSYNPIHRGHLGLLEAARALHAETISSGADASASVHGATKASSSFPGEVRRDEAREQGAAVLRPPSDGATDDTKDGTDGSSGVAIRAENVCAVFEITVANADKGGLDVDEVNRRVRQFSKAEGLGWPYPVVITRAPLFSHKAKLFPGCAFVVGADTAERIVDKKYYGNSQVEMVAALAEIRYLGCSFIVGGREASDGRFVTLEDVLEGSGLPETLRRMFRGLDETAFREDLSSTKIRQGTAKTGP